MGRTNRQKSRLFTKKLLEFGRIHNAISLILVLGIEVVCCCFHIKEFHKLILQICKSRVLIGHIAS